MASSSPKSFMGPAFVALAVVQAIQGLVLALAPGTSYDKFANFGPRSDHNLRDAATFYLATALALALAVRRPSWRVPVLVVCTAQYVLHGLNHVIDSGKASPGWIGPADAASLLVGAGVLGWLLVIAMREERLGR